MENKFVVVNVNGNFSGIYTYANTREEAEVEKDKAQAKAAEDVILFRGYSNKYGNDSNYWMNRVKEMENTKYEVMPFPEFEKKQRELVLSKPVHECTEEEFYQHLEMLPPLKWVKINEVEMFCMSEFDFGVYTTQYARVDGKHYCATVDYFDQSTWIHNRLPQ